MIFYFNSVIFFIYFFALFYIKVYAVPAFKLSYKFLLINVNYYFFANKKSFIIVCSSFLTDF